MTGIDVRGVAAACALALAACGSDEEKPEGAAGAAGAGGGAGAAGAAGEPPVPEWNEPSGLPEGPATSAFEIVGQISGAAKHGMPHMIDGYLLVPTPTDVRFFDVTDPVSPMEVGAASHAMAAEHYTVAISRSYPGTYAFTSGPRGAVVWDFTDPKAPTVVADVGVTGGGPLEYVNRTEALGLQAPWLFVPTSLGGIVVVDVTDPAAPVEVTTIAPADVGLAKTGYAFVVGNLLFTSCHSCAGIATVDVSDPTNPTPLGSITDTATFGYGLTVNGDRLYLATKGESGSVGVQIVDASDPAKLALSDKITAGAAHSGDGGYVSMQDGALHFGGSGLGYFKYDLASKAELGHIDLAAVPTGQDQDYAMGFSHLGVLGDDDAGITSLFFHQTDPDRAAPEVSLVIPLDGAADQALSSRVGITLTDWIDHRSVGPETFIVRPEGGAPIAGRLSVQHGIVNFTPDEPLTANTPYEVVVRSLRDAAGNPSARFESRFTTGGG